MRAEYDLFHEQAMLELSDGSFLDGSLPGVATIRARQIMAHPEFFGLCEGEQTGKDERLEIHLADAVARGENLLIFSVHVPEQERIVKLLESRGRRVGLMNASTSAAKRDRIDRAFQGVDHDGKFIGRTIDDVVGSPQTMAVGWNWEHVDHVIAASITHNDVDWLQAYRRASRGTRTKTLRVSLLQYADSIDQRVLEIVHQKSILANKVDPTRPILKLAA